MTAREIADAFRAAPRTVGAMLKTVARAFALVREASTAGLVLYAILNLVSGLVPAAIVVVAKWVVDGVVRAAHTGSPVDRDAVFRCIALELGLVVFSLGLGRLLNAATHMLFTVLGEHVNERVLEKALTLRLSDFEDPDFYDRMTRARKGASRGPLSVVDGVFAIAQALVGLGAFGALLAELSGWAVLLVVLAAVPQFIVATYFSKRRFKLGNWRSVDTRKQYYYESVLTSTENFKEVRLFGLGAFFLGRYREIFTRFEREDRRNAVTQGLWSFVLGAFASCGYYVAYAWVALQAMLSRITVGDLGMYLLVFTQGQGIITGMLGTIGSLYEDHLYMGSLFEYLDYPVPPEKRGGVTVGTDPRDGFRFEKVSFVYPGATTPALDAVTLHIPAGHKLALVGENGAGKTTIIKLLTRLYEPTSGRITLDGVDLNEWDGDALRQRVGVIFQDFVQYELSARENIGVGEIGAIEDEPRVREAAKLGMADEFIEALPAKYETQLGSWFPEGHELSIGQWQRVALARAFMRRGSDILVLDEPTASLDAQAEAHIFDRFRALADKRTAILISHRFSTTRMADSIAVVAGGKLIEHGSHDELLQRGGRYAELFFMQAKGYR